MRKAIFYKNLNKGLTFWGFDPIEFVLAFLPAIGCYFLLLNTVGWLFTVPGSLMTFSVVLFLIRVIKSSTRDDKILVKKILSFIYGSYLTNELTFDALGKNGHSYGSVLPYEFVEHGILISKTLNLSRFFLISSPILDGYSEHDIDKLYSKYDEILSELPEGDYQLYFEKTKFQDENSYNTQLLKEKKRIDESLYKLNAYFIVTKSYRNKCKHILGNKFDHKEVLEDFIDHTQIIERVLRHSFFVNPLNTLQVKQFLYRKINLDNNTNYFSADFSKNLQNLLPYEDVSPKDCRIGKNYFSIVSIYEPPNFTTNHMFDRLKHLDCEFDVSLRVKKENLDQMESRVNLIRNVSNASLTKSSGLVNISQAEKRAEAEAVLSATTMGEQIFRASLSIITSSQDKKKSAANSNRITACVTSGLSKVIEDNYFGVFLQNLPAFPNNTFLKYNYFLTKSLSHYFMVPEQPRNSGSHSMTLSLRSGEIVYFDPLAPNLINWNMLISGGSGAGKSFFLTNMLLELLARRKETDSNSKLPMVFFDRGGGLKKFVKSLGGKIVSNIPAINIFGTKDSIFLSNLIEELICDDIKVTTVHRNLINRAVKETISKNELNLDSFFQVLRNMDVNENEEKNQLVKFIGHSLERDVTKLLGCTDGISLSDEFILFDLDELKNRFSKKDQTLYMMSLLNLVDNWVGDDMQEKYLICDESINLFDTELSAKYLMHCVKTFRKKNIGLIVLVQSVKDLLLNKYSDKIPECTAIKVFLKSETYDEVKLISEKYGLNTRERDQLMSLDTVKGSYSEAFIIQSFGGETRRFVATLYPTETGYSITSTDPKENQVQKEKIK